MSKSVLQRFNVRSQKDCATTFEKNEKKNPIYDCIDIQWWGTSVITFCYSWEHMMPKAFVLNSRPVLLALYLCTMYSKSGSDLNCSGSNKCASAQRGKRAKIEKKEKIKSSPADFSLWNLSKLFRHFFAEGFFHSLSLFLFFCNSFRSNAEELKWQSN